MSRTILAPILASLLLSLPVPGAAETPRSGARRALDLRAAAYGGAFDGWGVREDSGGMSVFELLAKSELRGERWSLEVPARLSHRQTFGADLSETRGSLGVEPWWQVSPRSRVGLDVEIFGAYRPGWPDLYQRDGVPTSPTYGDIPPTDRYSYLAGRAGVQTYLHPVARQHLRARYRIAVYDYADDPNFDDDPVSPTFDLMHLTPRDRVQHEIDLSWRYLQRSWAFALRAGYEYRAYSTLLSRVRRTGGTNGDTTPEQKLHRLEPSAELELHPLEGKLELSFRYGYDVQVDPFQGYYSYGGHNPRLQVRYAASDRLHLAASYEGWYRTYGADGSTRLEGTDTRRTEGRTKVGGEVEYGLQRGLSLRAEVEWVRRTTNYRDYEPPASQFDIDFDYVNLAAMAGIAWRL